MFELQIIKRKFIYSLPIYGLTKLPDRCHVKTSCFFKCVFLAVPVPNKSVGEREIHVDYRSVGPLVVIILSQASLLDVGRCQ